MNGPSMDNLSMNKGERTRDSILNRGMLHSSRFGLADITIGTVSKLCGLSRTGVISHFKNKDDMQIAILEYSEQQFIDNVLKPSRHDDAVTQLKDLLRRWIDWTDQVFEGETTSCPFIKAVVEYEHRDDSPVRQHAFAQQQRIIDFLTHLIGEGQKQGRIENSVASQQIAYELYSLYVGMLITGSMATSQNHCLMFQDILKRGLARYEVVSS